VKFRLATIFVLCGFCTGILPLQIHAAPIRHEESAAPTAVELRMETVVLAKVNQQRVKYGLPTLVTNPLLTQAARDQSKWMAKNNAVAHTDLQGRNVGDRAQDAGYLYYTILGENLAMNSGFAKPVETAVAGWMKSTGHRDNILLAEYTETGIGVCIKGKEIYITQVFGNPPPVYPPE
ncbi:MAG: CAP domain-containing protein, partial [Armatimonadetes bacterium]|nr:CAP domain-containing protein [Armatimonadota bacterium]